VCRQLDKFGQPIALAVCGRCGTRQLNPRASEAEQRRFYRGGYYRVYKRDEKAKLPRWAAKKRTIASGILDAVEAHEPLAGQRLLDVGCGHGFLLADAAARGAKVFGVEPDESSSSALRGSGVSVFAGSLDYFVAANLEIFDVITLAHVLEHVSRPVAVLRSLRDLLQRQGLLCVEVPNARRPARRKRPALVPHAAHLYYFSETALRAAFEHAGFEVLAASYGRAGRDVRLLGRPGPLRSLEELELDEPEAVHRETRLALGMDSPTLRERLARLLA
jgi:2-polyprenyl-3-methyl-5-hydroxy-6-metoxy-1,4-benzoquinol methylase